MDIRILPGNIANMIAAGEVVQRPASVVKELMENAVDAGADHITVVIRDAGRTLIQVTDNGCGMSPDDAVVCFERHATSKIATAEDLEGITTFGFRGEALASIAAVAEVTLRTKREEDEVGCEVVFANSEQVSLSEVSAPRGANFSVRNLFYNVPARRKFLKSDNVEFKHIVSEFVRVALTRPEIAFDLIHNDRDVYILNSAKSLKFRIQDLLGAGAVKEVVDVSADTSIVRISGYVGRPDAARKASPNQFLFLNGRFFKSPYFHKAVVKAYENLVPDGTVPPYFIYMEVDPHTVDVNIHPTKTEIKFEEDSVIFQVLFACIKEALGKNSFGSSIDFDRGDVPEIPVFGRHFDEIYPVEEPQMGTDPTFNPFVNDGFPSEVSHFSNSFGCQDPVCPDSHGVMPPVHDSYGGTAVHVDKRDDYGKLFEDKVLPSKAVLTLQGRYIVTSVRSGMLVINVRRAMERILFERFLKAVSQNVHVTQTTLFPVSVQVGVEQRILFEEHAELLSSLGFDISPFGNDTVVVNGVPEGYSAEPGKVQVMVSDLVSVLSDDHGSLAGTMASSVAEKFAKVGAAGGDAVIASSEAQRLIDALFACSNAEFTSSGHRIMTIMTIDELDKKF